jgi:hypothetical protein
MDHTKGNINNEDVPRDGQQLLLTGLFDDYYSTHPIRHYAHRTNTGRVVYNRKKHSFNTRDLLRIVENTNKNWIYEPYQQVVGNRLRVVRDIVIQWLLWNGGIGTEEYDLPESPYKSLVEQLGRDAAELVGAETFGKIPGVGPALGAEIGEKVYNFLLPRMYRLIDSIIGG